jgi:hypothetical protein
VREAAYANRPKPEDVPPVVPVSAAEEKKSEEQKPQPSTPRSPPTA